MEELEYRDYKFKIRKGVYPPDEDSFMLVEEILKLEGSLLEIGCGCGIASIIYEREKRKEKKIYEVVGLDINKKAVGNSRENAKLNLSSAKFYFSNEFEWVRKKSKKFDYVAFNAPYLGTDSERKGKREKSLYDKGQIDEYIRNVKKYAKKGFVLVLSDANEKFEDYLSLLKRKFKVMKISKRHFFFENIYCIRINFKDAKKFKRMKV